MGMTSSIGRTLFAQMPPSIVINEPLPRWKAIVLAGLKVATGVLVSSALFYAGIHYERYRQRAAGPAPVQAAEPNGTPVPQERTAPAATQAELMETRKTEGLEIQTLQVVRDNAVRGQLRYDFAVANEGRLYEGALEFVISGSQEGRPTLWEYPGAGQRNDSRFQMRVGRYVKAEGKIQLPAGLQAEAVVLRLREPSGNIRASRAVVLAPSTEK